MDTTLEEVLERIPHFKNVDSIRTTFLSGGITNLNYRVDMKDKSYVVRICGNNSEPLGINRQCEPEVNRRISQIGIAPKVVWSLLPEGHMASEFIEGRSLDISEIGEEINLRLIASHMRRYHALDEISHHFVPFEIFRKYEDIARSRDVVFPDNYLWMQKKLFEIEKLFENRSMIIGLCHNDLLNANFIHDGKTIRIIDWEYAGMGNIYFDLANFSAHHQLSEHQDIILLDTYFDGNTGEIHHAYLNLMKIVSDFREGMWAQVQKGISNLDFDYHDYAVKYFLLVEQRINDRNFLKWMTSIN